MENDDKRGYAMRTIQVSADLYAAIWKQQQAGEASEEVILRRILKVPRDETVATPSAPPSVLHAAGLYDRRNDVWFTAGLEIFRTYRGKEYRAQVVGGLWYRPDTREMYPSVNKLSDSIGASENAWDGWLYRDKTSGKVTPISKLRDQSKIRKRTRIPTAAELAEIGLRP
jgi:hypothetical protein